MFSLVVVSNLNWKSQSKSDFHLKLQSLLFFVYATCAFFSKAISSLPFSLPSIIVLYQFPQTKNKRLSRWEWRISFKCTGHTKHEMAKPEIVLSLWVAIISYFLCFMSLSHTDVSLCLPYAWHYLLASASHTKLETKLAGSRKPWWLWDLNFYLPSWDRVWHCVSSHLRQYPLTWKQLRHFY